MACSTQFNKIKEAKRLSKIAAVKRRRENEAILFGIILTELESLGVDTSRAKFITPLYRHPHVKICGMRFGVWYVSGGYYTIVQLNYKLDPLNFDGLETLADIQLPAARQFAHWLQRKV